MTVRMKDLSQIVRELEDCDKFLSDPPLIGHGRAPQSLHNTLQASAETAVALRRKTLITVLKQMGVEVVA